MLKNSFVKASSHCLYFWSFQLWRLAGPFSCTGRGCLWSPLLGSGRPVHHAFSQRGTASNKNPWLILRWVYPDVLCRLKDGSNDLESSNLLGNHEQLVWFIYQPPANAAGFSWAWDVRLYRHEHHINPNTSSATSTSSSRYALTALPYL